VLSMHGFFFAGYLFFLCLFNLIASMTLWFRDVISEGTIYNILCPNSDNFIIKTTRVINK
jgi:hypothetical protein